MRIALFVLFAGVVIADTVTLKTGEVLTGKVVRDDDKEVVLNPFNCGMKEMVWGVKTFDRHQVAKVEITPDPPIRVYWLNASVARPNHADLMKYCVANKLDAEARHEAELVLASDPSNAEALALVGAAAPALLKASPLHNADLRARSADYGALDVPGRKAAYETWKKDLGVTLPQAYFDRVARSLKQPKGLQEDVKLTWNTKKTTGRYTIWVPEDYDPHKCYPMILGLHGAVNGLGGAGNGKDFAKHFLVEAPKWGCIVVAPTADPLPWTSKGDDFVLSVLQEVQLLYNVDLNAVYIIGHSRGGMGTWYFGPQYADKFAAMAPAAGSGGGNAMRAVQQGTGIYIYHSSDDTTVACGEDRGAAQTLSKQKGCDFVYNEWTNQGHGWPREVIDDTLLYFKKHRRMEKGPKGPVPTHGKRMSFAEPMLPGEMQYFPVEAAGGEGKNELAKLLADIETGGSLGEKAATKIIEGKDKAAVNPLAKILGTPSASEDARQQAARALGAFKDGGAVSALARGLSDKSLKVRKAAAESLATAGEKKDAMAVAGALDALGKEFEDDAKSKMGQLRWEEYHLLNAALVSTLGALGETRTWSAISSVAVKKILLTDKLPKSSAGYDAELVRKKAALAILAALPGLKEAKLKADVEAIRLKFSADAEVQSAAKDAAGKLP